MVILNRKSLLNLKKIIFLHTNNKDVDFKNLILKKIINTREHNLWKLESYFTEMTQDINCPHQT